ncbi:MAG: hypothetical protein U0K86_10940 [Agathobacter sp.]|nr:hypothetical protein [Agathobacter sp.]
MRCNQVSIFIERFGDYVPKNYPGDVQRISVYVDDFTSIYAALSKAYALAINELSEYEQIGARADVSTNEYAKSDYKEMHGTIPKEKRSYDNDINLQYVDTHYELCKDYTWIFEHSTEVVDLIKSSQNHEEMIIELKEKYGLSDYQIKKLSQIRLDMLTMEKYKECKEKIKEIDDRRENNFDTNLYNKDSYKKYSRKQLEKCKLRQQELEAYFIAVDNLAEIIKIMEENAEFHEFAKVMESRFGFSWNQSRYFRNMTIQSFDPKSREEKRQELKQVIRDIKMFEEEL